MKRGLSAVEVLPRDSDLHTALDGDEAAVLLDHLDLQRALRGRRHGGRRRPESLLLDQEIKVCTQRGLVGFGGGPFFLRGGGPLFCQKQWA